MIIFIVGNIASGKTTTCLELKKLMPNYEYISIDDFRRSFNTGKNIAGEEMAQRLFIAKMKNQGYLIIETTGTGRHWLKYLEAVSGNTLVVRLDCHADICNVRSQNRTANNYKLPPIPKEWNMGNIPMTIDWMRDRIPSGELRIRTDKFTAKKAALKIKKYIEMDDKTFKEKFLEMLGLYV